jgi:hypothetical protein
MRPTIHTYIYTYIQVDGLKRWLTCILNEANNTYIHTHIQVDGLKRWLTCRLNETNITDAVRFACGDVYDEELVAACR